MSPPNQTIETSIDPTGKNTTQFSITQKRMCNQSPVQAVARPHGARDDRRRSTPGIHAFVDTSHILWVAIHTGRS